VRSSLAGDWRLSRCDSVSSSWRGIAVPVELYFKQTDILVRKSAFSGLFGLNGARRVQLGQSAALYCRVSTADQTCARQERDLRAFARKAGYKVVGVWKETASGAKQERAERKKVLALAQARKVDVILVTELTRWGRSMLDLFHTLQDLQAWGVSLVAQTGLQFDLRSAQGKLIASLMAALAEFEQDLLRERVRSGIAAARKRGVVFGRRPGQRVKADRFAPKVLKLVGEGQSYREISHRLGLSKNTILDIVKRDRVA
jgi:putative DNA-invertase from lambdoid prophage Rac